MPSEKKPFFGHQYIFLWTPLVKFRLLPNPTHFGSELGIFPFNPFPLPFYIMQHTKLTIVRAYKACVRNAFKYSL